MTLMRLLPRDEHGTPRPLRGHGEAVRWAAATAARPFRSRRSLGGLGGVGGISLIRYLSEDEPDLRSLAFALAGLVVAAACLWLAGALLLYLYAFLLGGVQGREERGRPRGDG